MLALSKPLDQILLEIIECLREEAHALALLIDLVNLRCGGVLDNEWLRVQLVWIELEDVFEVGSSLQLEVSILLHIQLAINTLIRQDKL